MKFIISGDNWPINQKIKDLTDKHIGQKIDKYLKSFDQGLKTARLKITKGPRWGFGASLKIRLPKREISAKSQAKNLLKALTIIRNQAIRQIKEYKEKIKART